jgi:hypothetical protein
MIITSSERWESTDIHIPHHSQFTAITLSNFSLLSSLSSLHSFMCLFSVCYLFVFNCLYDGLIHLFTLHHREKRESVDITFADFDGVQFHVSTLPDNKNVINVSISHKGAQTVLKDFGGKELLSKYYGSLLQGMDLLEHVT